MKISKKLITIILLVLVVFLIGNRILEEKYCYNYGFAQLDKKGINKLEEAALKLKGYSPLDANSIVTNIDWWDAYKKCQNEFNLLNINFSVLQKSYPNYDHFIDW